MSIINVGARPSASERRRAARIKEAVAYMDANLSGRWDGRASAIRSIERAHSAMKEAKRITEWRLRKIAGPRQGKVRRAGATEAVRYVWPKTHVDHRDHPDHSDVQELRVKIAKRDGALFDPVHKRALARLDRDIDQLSSGAAALPLRGSADQFAKRAAKVIRMPQVVPLGFIAAELAAHKIKEVAPSQDDDRSSDLYRDRWGFMHREPATTRQLVTAGAPTY